MTFTFSPAGPITRGFADREPPVGTTGRAIAINAAMQHVLSHAVGIDMARRDLEFALRDEGGPLEMGTGTPEGVGPVERGQVITGGIDGLGELAIRLV